MHQLLPIVVSAAFGAIYKFAPPQPTLREEGGVHIARLAR